MFDIFIEKYNFVLSNLAIADEKYYWFALFSGVFYFVFKFLVEYKIYKANKNKRESTVLNLKIISVSIILGSLLEASGFHSKWITYFTGGVSAILVAYNIGSWGIFNKLATVLETKKKVEDEQLIESLLKHVESSNIDSSIEFKYNGKRYIYSNNGKKIFRELGILLQTNKNTRLYDMFLSLGLFFFALLFMAFIFDAVISKDSMIYGVLLLFGAAFILPYLQDVKHTIRFANNKYLAYGAFVSFYVNGKELFGEIIDMNLYEIILMNHWTKTKIIISHNEIKTFAVYDNGRLFSFLYVISKEVKYKLYKVLKQWLTEYNSENKEVLNIETFKVFFKTKDDDHGLQFYVFIKQEALKKYGLIINQVEHYIQEKSDKEEWDLCTPKRVDLKVIKTEEQNKNLVIPD